MKVLNICAQDYANFSHDNGNALRSVGVHCFDVKRYPHPSNYPEQSKVIDYDMMKAMIAEYDVIQFFHDNLDMFKMMLPVMRGKKIIAWHTSSHYRKDHKIINAVMNPVIYRGICAMPEFIGMGSKNEVYVTGAVDTEEIKPESWGTWSPVVFAHYPSDPQVKGTYHILRMMGKTKAEFKHDIKPVSFSEQRKRMNACDVYIELFAEKDGQGSRYGNFGITALEAAAMGKIVITQSRNESVYASNYGINTPFIKVPDEAAFYKAVNDLLSMSATEIISLKKRHRMWVESRHSYKATGERIKRLL